MIRDEPMTNTRAAVWLFALLQVPAAFLSLGHHFPDEHFQVLELLNYKLGLTPTSALPWEFHEAIRPFTQIAVYYPIVSVERALGVVSPFVYEITLRLLSVSLGIAAFAMGLGYLSRIYTFDRRALLAMSSFAALPYLNARLSFETVGASIFFLGLFATLRGIENQKHAWVFAGGLLLALAFHVRVQLAFMLMGLALWFVVEKRVFANRALRDTLPLVAGMVLGVLLAVLADHWGYGRWTFTPWSYVDAQFLRNKAAAWGTAPWWDYLRMMSYQMMPPLGPLYFLVIVWFLSRERRSVLTYLMVPFFIGHCLVGHKEYRFLFPLALPFTFMLGIMLQATTVVGWKKVLFVIFTGANVLWLVVLPYRPASIEVMTYRYIYSHGVKDIYSMGGDPYTMAGLSVHFYRPPGVRIFRVTLEELQNTMARQPVTLFTERLLPFETGSVLERSCVAEYRSIPEWADQVNVNDWLSRIPVWSLYRCRL